MRRPLDPATEREEEAAGGGVASRLPMMVGTRGRSRGLSRLRPDSLRIRTCSGACCLGQVRRPRTTTRGFTARTRRCQLALGLFSLRALHTFGESSAKSRRRMNESSECGEGRRLDALQHRLDAPVPAEVSALPSQLPRSIRHCCGSLRTCLMRSTSEPPSQAPHSDNDLGPGVSPRVDRSP